MRIISSDPLAEELDADVDALNEVEVRRCTLGEHLHGFRLDKALQDFVPEFSRSYLQQLLEEGAVTLNGVPATKSAQKVRAGDSIELQLRPTAQSQAFKPECIPLDVVFADEHLLIVNKPAGLVVHPAPGNWTGTLLNALLHSFPANAGVPRAGIVHRLDKDTSGLMVVARTRACMDALVTAIAARTVSRQYLAIGHKAWRHGPFVCVEAAIGRDPRNRLRMAAVDLSRAAGKPARTDFYLLDNADDVCWVRCVLHTGRTHQIRVHMALIGHPLVGDTVYGGHAREGMDRQALHAFQLAFAHPVTGQPLVFTAPVPPDMARVLTLWGVGYNDFEGARAAPFGSETVEPR